MRALSYHKLILMTLNALRSFVTQNLRACRICAVAKSNIQSSLSKKKKAGRPKVKDVADTPKHPDHRLVVCSKCFSRIGKGYSHDCTRRGKVANVESLLSKTPTTSERVASRIVHNSENAESKTLGPNPLPVGKNKMKKRLFTVDDMSMIQRDLSLSNKKLKILTEELRSSSGSRNLIE